MNAECTRKPMPHVCCASMLAWLSILLSGSAIAHDTTTSSDSSWVFDPLPVTLLLLAGAGYLLGVIRIRQAQRQALLKPWRIAAFVVGSLLLVLALLSPLDRLAESSFSAHMIQHLLLMLGAPPLLVASHPMIAWLWCGSPARRSRLSRWWAGRAPARRAIGVLLHPASVWIGATLALWFWHLPGPYSWALGNESVHTIEHTSFFLTSLAFWYVLFEPRGRARLGHGGAILFALTFGMQNGFLGAILTFANHPLYAAYAGSHGAGPSGLTPLQDQQLAGVLMWVPAGILHLTLMSTLMAQWLRDAGRATRRTRMGTRGLKTTITVQDND